MQENTAEDAELRAELEALLAAHEAGDGNTDLERGLQALDRLDADAMLGQYIGPYELCKVLGEGGMGVVYEAAQEEPIRRRVALKLIRLGMDSREVVARFESERQALALMSHPAIARVLDAGASETGRPYFVMEFVPGDPLTQACDDRSLSLRERIEVFLEVLDGVQHAHAKGIIHRDIKPSNILLDDSAGRLQPKIIDFGIAKALTHKLTDETILTRLGRLVGTPAYMSPEQARGNSMDVDTRSDIYALGVVLYELVTGQRPADAERGGVLSRPSRTLPAGLDEQAAIARCRRTTPKRLRRFVSGDLDWVVLKALDPERERRYLSVDEFARDLRRFLANEPVTARAPGAMYRASKFVARHKFAAGAAALVAISLLVALLGLAAGLQQAREAQAIAERERNYAESTSEFLQGMLTAASPYVAQGADTTVLKNLLDDAAARVETETAGEPRLAADLHHTISTTYRALGLLDRAEAHARLALDAALASDLGPDAPRTLYLRGRVALQLWAQGRMEESVAISEEVLQRQEAILGPAHPETISTLNNVAVAYKALERFDEAEAMYRSVIDRREERFGPGHRSTLIAENNLANLYRDTNRPLQALPIMRGVVERAEDSLGEDDPDTIAFTDSYGNILVKAGRLDEAEAIHRDVIARMSRVNGPDHPDTMGAVYHLGQVYMARENFALAEEQFRRVRQTVSRTLGADHRYTLFATAWLAKSLMQQARWPEAEPLLREALGSSQALFPPGHSQTAVLQCRLGGVLAEQGAREEALTLLTACGPMLADALPDDNEDRLESARYLERLSLD